MWIKCRLHHSRNDVKQQAGGTINLCQFASSGVTHTPIIISIMVKSFEMD